MPLGFDFGMILGSFVLFAFAFLLLPIPPAAFLVWLVSVIMFFAGVNARGTRKAVAKQTKVVTEAIGPSRSPAVMRECPSCKEQMRRDASVCPHCRRESPAWRFHESKWWTKGSNDQWYWLDVKTNKWILSEEQ